MFILEISKHKGQNCTFLVILFKWIVPVHNIENTVLQPFVSDGETKQAE